MVKIHRRNKYGGAEAPNDQELHGLHRAGYLAGAYQPLQARLVWLNGKVDHHNRIGSSHSKDPFLLWHRLALRDTKLPGHPGVHLVFRA
jgi:hypothetical protein